MKKTKLSIFRLFLVSALFTMPIIFSACSKEDDDEAVITEESQVTLEVEQDSYEPNNSLSQAATITMATSVEASISDSVDEDYFVITGTAISKVDIFKIELTNQSTASFQLTIYNKDKAKIAEVPYGGNSENLSYEFQTNESEFYVKIIATSVTSYPAEYQIKGAFENVADEFEGNDLISTAALFPLDTEKECNLLKDDQDFYKVRDLSSEDVWDAYQVKFVNKSTSLNPSISFYDESKALLSTPQILSAGAGLDTTKTFYMKSGANNGRYIKIYSDSSFSDLFAQYALTVKKLNVNEASEPNDSYTTSATPTVNSTNTTITGTVVLGTLSDDPDYDYIKVVVAAGETLTYKVEGTYIMYDAYTSFDSGATPTAYITDASSSSYSTRSISNTSPVLSMYFYLRLKGTKDLSKYTITASLVVDN